MKFDFTRRGESEHINNRNIKLIKLLRKLNIHKILWIQENGSYLEHKLTQAKTKC